MLRDSTPRYVGPSVGQFVGLSPFYFFGVFWVLSIRLLPRCPSDLLQHATKIVTVLGGTVSFAVLAMRPMKEGTKMLMSNECGDNATVESLLLSMLLSRILSMTLY